MIYTNVPLPKPFVDKIDQIIAEKGSSYRSRPEYILTHLRQVIERDLEKHSLGQKGNPGQ